MGNGDAAEANIDNGLPVLFGCRYELKEGGRGSPIGIWIIQKPTAHNQ